jgi:hypothetical protein
MVDFNALQCPTVEPLPARCVALLTNGIVAIVRIRVSVCFQVTAKAAVPQTFELPLLFVLVRPRCL